MLLTLIRNWFFQELFTERFLRESKMILLCHCCENPILEPLFLRVHTLKAYHMLTRTVKQEMNQQSQTLWSFNMCLMISIWTRTMRTEPRPQNLKSIGGLLLLIQCLDHILMKDAVTYQSIQCEFPTSACL